MHHLKDECILHSISGSRKGDVIISGDVMSNIGGRVWVIIPVPDTEPAKAGICARDRRALQQLALKVHLKHSELT